MAEDGDAEEYVRERIMSVESDVKDLLKTASNLSKLNKKLAARVLNLHPPNLNLEKKKARESNLNYLDSLRPGFWFFPSDKMLMKALKAKMLNQQHLLSDKYRNINMYQYTPQQLSELHEPGRESVWYFFVKKGQIYVGVKGRWDI